jgi:hypothetical protein
MRKQFVIDKKTNKLLEELASYHGGNRSPGCPPRHAGLTLTWKTVWEKSRRIPRFKP